MARDYKKLRVFHDAHGLVIAIYLSEYAAAGVRRTVRPVLEVVTGAHRSDPAIGRGAATDDVVVVLLLVTTTDRSGPAGAEVVRVQTAAEMEEAVLRQDPGLAVPAFAAPFMPCVEVGWRLRHEYWGRGIAFRAAREALRYGFSVLQLPEVVSFTATVNLRSRRLMERLHPRYPGYGWDHNRGYATDDHRDAIRRLYRIDENPDNWPFYPTYPGTTYRAFDVNVLEYVDNINFATTCTFDCSMYIYTGAFDAAAPTDNFFFANGYGATDNAVYFYGPLEIGHYTILVTGQDGVCPIRRVAGQGR